MPTLFDPVTLGDLQLPNRVLMAPLTRCRANISVRVPTPLMVEYYTQRASAGLIVSEATSVDPMGVGYKDTPGIWSEAQVAGWKAITDSVHRAGGRMILQLWHVGRISDPIYLNGERPVASSEIAPPGNVSQVVPPKPFITPRALETSEIPGVIAAFAKGAANAKAAGFDGVEIHGANGYLLDQFLQDTTNTRTDAYGGAIERRARLMLEVADACISVWGAGRIGMHVAPRCDIHGMGDSNPPETFGYVARELGKRKLAFLCARESKSGTPAWLGPQLAAAFKKAGGGAYIANENFTYQSAADVLEVGEADAVAFGKLFIANPDLPRRLEEGTPLNPARPELFYGPGAEGYTDYPAAHSAREGSANRTSSAVGIGGKASSIR